MKAKQTVYDLQREKPVTISKEVLAMIKDGIKAKDYHLNKKGGSLSFKGKTVSITVPLGGDHVGFFIMPKEALK